MRSYVGKGYRLTITGDRATQKRLGGLMVAYPEATKKMMKQEGDEILIEAVNNAPEDTGALKESGKVVEGEEAGGYMVAVGFGDPKVLNKKSKKPTSAYARYQHEMPFPHAKYLEIPFMNRIGTLSARIAAKLGVVR